MFEIGQRVVCVDDDWSHPLIHLMPHRATKGGIYHVRDIVGPWLRLAEIVNPAPFGFMEPQFADYCFRPIVERKTNISLFTELLTPLRPRVLDKVLS